jgi:hypothetical protein
VDGTVTVVAHALVRPTPIRFQQRGGWGRRRRRGCFGRRCARCRRDRLVAARGHRLLAVRIRFAVGLGGVLVVRARPATSGTSTFVHATVMREMVDAPPGRPRRARCLLRNLLVMLVCQRCATSRRTRGRNRSESKRGRAVRNRRDVAGSMRRDAFSAFCRWERGLLTRYRQSCTAARRFSFAVNRSNAEPQPRQS